MTPLTFTLRPRTAFATPLMGDTLFGQLCWAIRHGWGEARLTQLLEGYTAGQPFLVVSDAFPAGHLPLPALPASAWAGTPASARERKALKQKVWLPRAALSSPLETWQQQAVDRRRVSADFFRRPQPRNSLNRLTNATGKGDGFSPYTVPQHWFGCDAVLDLHVRLDSDRLGTADLTEALAFIGHTGFGKDASVGLGKFDIAATDTPAMPGHDEADAWFTLAPCAPQGLGWNTPRCFYRPFTRYGRHGDLAVRLGKPFKSPLLLAATGALLTPRAQDDWSRGWVGQGLGGNSSLSKVLAATVHQGYAPAIPVRLPAMLAKEAA
jgi:CRISPR-associated protein Csm4